jgi:hypothetical protein
MKNRQDIFILSGADDGPVEPGHYRHWRPYAEAVTPANARRIAAALEADGEQVLICTHARILGKHVYQTSTGAT